MPADDTIARIISAIKPELFRECFLHWMQSVHELTQGELVAIDGKTLRGSYNREDRLSTIHMISVYASDSVERRGCVKQPEQASQLSHSGRRKVHGQAKPFAISKWDVQSAFEKVKANRGGAGIDGRAGSNFVNEI